MKKINNHLRNAESSFETRGGKIRLSEVMMALNNMDATEAEGPDSLHLRLLKNLPEEVEMDWIPKSG